MPPEPAGIEARQDRVLIADDDPLFLEIASGALKGEKLNLTMAGSGAECAALLESVSFDLVVLDCGLSSPNEFALMDMLQRRHPQCQVMILSARSGDWHDRVMKLYGARHVVAKPIRPDRLVGEIMKALGNVSRG